MTSRKNAENTRGKPFEPGNPGRPKGARNKATLAAEALLDGEAETLTRKAIELALSGDIQALRICLERIIPARKSRPIQIDLPPVKEPQDVLAAITTTLKAVGHGELTPEEGHVLASLLEQARRSQELVDLDERMQALEQQISKGR